MGTNFYYNGDSSVDEDSLRRHIGKRSGAGLFCRDCEVTFCQDGTQRLHFSQLQHKVCPNCGGEGTYATSFTWTLGRHLRDLQDLRGYEVPVVVDEYGDEYTAEEFLAIIEGIPRLLHFQLAMRFS
jgi:hypothetical protein